MTKIKAEVEAKPKPSPIDYEVAEREFGEGWPMLPTAKRNRLAKDQMYHREYADLCDAIRGYRVDKPTK